MNIDVARLHTLSEHIRALDTEKKGVKQEFDDIVEHAITALVQLNVRYIDVSQTGEGPFWVLGKSKNESGFNRERLQEFFRILLTELQQNPGRATPEVCTQLALEYLTRFQKRKLVLNKSTRAPIGNDVEELKRWLSHGTRRS